MNNIVVFLGPSLPLEKAEAILPNATYLSPVKCGDILRLLENPPAKVAIIDGNFHQCAAVWHKEILYAMERGVAVYGAASMGALRAAELAAFGMQGVGTIFEWYRDGVVEGDDEVALLHSDANSKIQFSTEPLVNWRATLAAAQKQQIISAKQAQELLNAISDIYYQERRYEQVIDLLKEKDQQALIAWLNQDNYVDQKALDAIALLQLIEKEAIVPSEITTEKTVGLHRLKGYISCEVNPTVKSIDNLRIKRLLAYTLKTADRIAPIACDALDEQIALCQENKWSENDCQDSVRVIANHLALLQKQSAEDRELYNRVNYFVALVVAKIFAIFDIKKITITPNKLAKAKMELAFLKPENVDDALLMTYTTLKDFINNDFDLFFVDTQLLGGKSYFEEAERLFVTFMSRELCIQI